MEKLMGIYQWIVEHGPIVFGVLFGVSEALALIPAIRANSIFQLISNAIKGIKEKFKIPGPAA